MGTTRVGRDINSRSMIIYRVLHRILRDATVIVRMCNGNIERHIRRDGLQAENIYIHPRSAEGTGTKIANKSGVCWS